MDGSGGVRLASVDDGTTAPGAGTASQRQRQRDSLFLSAQLRLDGEAKVRDVRVRNLSEGGLMAELDRTVETGTPVTLEMRGLGELTGRVAWCTRGRMGIAFDAPIDPARARKPVGSGKGTPGLAKPMVVSAPRR